MTFGNPPLVSLVFLVLPLLSAFLYFTWRKKQRDIGQFVRSRLLARLTVGISTTRQKLRLMLSVVAVGSLLLAMARPQWGHTWEETSRKGLDILVALDTSRSMLAEDVTPNRLERARLAALDLVPLARSDRLGLIAFAGSAFLQCPLTVDDEAFRQNVKIVEAGIMPQGGTSLGAAILTALSSFKVDSDNEKILILVTDGEDHEAGAVEAAQEAAKAGVRIFTVGVGTPQGELIRVRDESGGSSFVKDPDGNAVKSRLNEPLLRQIAEAARGFYLPLTGANAMETLYERGLAPLLPRFRSAVGSAPTEPATKLLEKPREQFQWFLALSLLALILEFFLPDRKFVWRPAQAQPHAAYLNAARLLALLLLTPGTWSASASSASARRDYDAGHYESAQREFERLLKKNPQDPSLAYNAGTAAHQAKDFEVAREHLNQALTAPNLNLQQHAYYNLGKSLYQLGEQAQPPSEKTQLWEESLNRFDSARRLNTNDLDAQFNYDFVKKRLEEFKKQQQQQQQEQNQKQNDKDSSQPQNQDQQSEKDKNQPSASPDQSSESEQKKNDASTKPDSAEKPDSTKEPAKPPKPDDNRQPRSSDSSAAAAKPGSTNENASAEGGIPEGQMTPQQARQLLDNHKSDEKALLFNQRDQRDRRSRAFKDW